MAKDQQATVRIPVTLANAEMMNLKGINLEKIAKSEKINFKGIDLNRGMGSILIGILMSEGGTSPEI